MRTHEYIRELEIRVANLERQAGFIDDISSTFKGLVNIPKNIVKKIINGFADIYNTVNLEVEGNKSKINDSLGALLGSRIFRAMAGVTTTRAGLPKIVSFNPSDPLKSIFTGGKAEDKKIPLKTIVPDTPEVREFFKEHYDMQCELTDILYVPASGMFENEMNIYNDKVSIIHLEKGSEYGVVIQDSQIAEMHRSMFDIMWQKFKNEYGKKKIG